MLLLGHSLNTTSEADIACSLPICTRIWYLLNFYGYSELLGSTHCEVSLQIGSFESVLVLRDLLKPVGRKPCTVSCEDGRTRTGHAAPVSLCGCGFHCHCRVRLNVKSGFITFIKITSGNVTSVHFLLWLTR